MTRWSSLPLALLLLVLVPAVAGAHPLAPLGVRVSEGAGEIEVSLKRARVQPKGAVFAVRCPAGCAPLGDVHYEETESYVIERRRWRCASSLVGAAFGVDGLTEADVDAVMHVTLSDGRVLSALLDRSEDSYVVPERVTRAKLAGDFVRSGLGHLLGGFDHLLFVLGLVLLFRRARPVLLALSAFTVGHAVSLGAATLGWSSIPPRVAEIAIAASLVWLAHAIVRRPERADGELGRPYVTALGIGLVHGLGFAAVFSSAGLGGGDLALALGAFHVGIELGQLAVVFAALLLVRLARRRRHTAHVELFCAYAIGSLAMMWLIERAVA